MSLSVAIVCKNNISTIGRTIESVRALAGEIVAIDSGSGDGTIELLESAGARVIHSPWLGHVRTKQLALDSCSLDWILCIDSDESLDADLAASIRDACDPGAPARISGCMINRMTYYRDRPLRHVWQPEWRLRLVRRAKARWGGLDPHDKLDLLPGEPAPARLRGTMRHDSFSTFAEHLRKQYDHAATMARSLHASGVRGSRLRLLVSPAGALIKQLVLKGGVLDGVPGFLAAASTAAAAIIKHSVLLELSSNERDSRP